MQALRKSGETTIAELSETVDLSPGTIHTHLATLQSEGFAIQSGEKYRLGYQLLTLGESVRNFTELFRAGREVIDQLADETGESAHLVIESGGSEIVLYESFGKQAVGTNFYVSNREDPKRYLHCSAAGKAILAHLPDDRVDEIVEQNGLASVTKNTITDREELRSELEAIRDNGFALNDEEQVMGIRAVAAPILKDSDGVSTVTGALSISAPLSRLQSARFEEECPEKMRNAANIIEINLNTRGKV